jgi:hypothetical protein
MKRSVRILGRAAGIFVVGVTGLYVVLLGMEAYSQRQASLLLDRVEALRLGDPEANFDSAVKGFPVKKIRSGTLCTMTSGAYRFATLWRVIDELPEKPGSSIWTFCNRAGLRYWHLDVSSSSDGGHIRDLWAYLYVVGRYEGLGAEWRIAPAVPLPYSRNIGEPYDQRTYMTWYHITSSPSGEGFAIYATPKSTDNELTARKINRGCFLSFRGCDGLCELLPDAIPVLVGRQRDWGGGSCVPRSHCDFANKWDPCG